MHFFPQLYAFQGTVSTEHVTIGMCPFFQVTLKKQNKKIFLKVCRNPLPASPSGMWGLEIILIVLRKDKKTEEQRNFL